MQSAVQLSHVTDTSNTTLSRQRGPCKRCSLKCKDSPNTLMQNGGLDQALPMQSVGIHST